MPFSLRPVFLTFRALRSRNYRLFFCGQSVSLVGYWMTRVATGWLVYRMTGSVFLLGLVNFASQIPTSFLVPLAGVLIDRWNKHRILTITQILSMIQPFLMAYLVMSHQIQIGHILALSVFQGLVHAFDIPVRQSLIVEMVDRKTDMSNAIALNSTMFNLARLIGPSIAGIVIALAGEAWCFLVDGLSYFPVIASILMMKLKPHQAKPAGNVMHGLREGFEYAFGFVPVRSLLLLVAIVSLWGMSYLVLLPVFARDILHGGPSTLGFLTAASGLGALGGAIFLALQKNVLSFGKFISRGALAGSVAIIVLSFSASIWFSMIAIMIAGFGFMIQLASSNTVLQTLADDDKRGRVMSFYTLSFLGVAPFGSLLAGNLAHWLSAQASVCIGGVICFAAALMLHTRILEISSLLHPVPARRGRIAPEIASGIDAASQLQDPKE